MPFFVGVLVLVLYCEIRKYYIDNVTRESLQLVMLKLWGNRLDEQDFSR